MQPRHITASAEIQSCISDFQINPDTLRTLSKNPGRVLQAEIGGCECTFTIVSPHYVELISDYYKKELRQSLDYYHTQLKIPILFTHFGLRIEFSKPTELHLHGKEMVLPDSIKQLLKNFGVLILQNVYLDTSVRDMGHRNRFPQLNFHVDRVSSQVSYYSVYTRNPFDNEQKYPRTSSTLFIPTLVAYLQGLAEGKTDILSGEGLISNAVLYNPETITPLLNKIIVQHSWDKPTSTGEISIINNCNILHSSYYPNIHNLGYRIGVRYLA